MRSALYDSLTNIRRARLHQRVAEAMEELSGPSPGPHLAELAHHWFGSAQPAGVAKGVAYARQAGDWALEKLAYEEAIAHYEQALTGLAPRTREERLLRCDLLLALGGAQRQAGEPAYRSTMETVAREAERLGEPERMALGALGMALACSWFVSASYLDEPVVALYQDALAALDGGGGVLRARLLAQLAVETYYTAPSEHRRMLCDEALAIVRQADDRASLATVLAPCIVAIWDPSTLEERLTRADELTALAAELEESQELAVQARLLRAGCRFEAGNSAGAGEDFAAAIALAEEMHQPFYVWMAHLVQTMEAILAGPPDRAEACAVDTFQVGQDAGQSDAALIFTIHFALIRWDQGRAQEVLPALEASAASLPRMPSFRAGLALNYWHQGRENEARQLFENLVDSAGDVPFDWGWYSAMSLLGETCAFLGDARRAPVLYQLLVPFAERLALIGCVHGCLGSMWRVLALLAATEGDWARAEDHFERALVTNRRIGARNFAVRTERAYAEMLLARNRPGDVGRARELASAAMRTAEELGMSFELERLRKLLALTPAPAS